MSDWKKLKTLRHKMKLTNLIAVFALCIAVSDSASAQLCGQYTTTLVITDAQNAENFQFYGTVFDINKAVIVGAKVRAQDDNGREFKTVTNSDGEYELLLPFGKYALEFTAEGFKSTPIVGVEIVNKQNKKLDITLETGYCEDCGGRLYGELPPDYGYVVGKVSGKNGSGLSGFEVIFTRNNKIFKTKTDGKGTFKIKLTEGNYDIKVEEKGAERLRMTGYSVREPGNILEITL